MNDSSFKTSSAFTASSPAVTIRLAGSGDKPAFIDLWKICFTDTPEFIEWFFQNRFFPEYSACVEIGGTVVCAMQSMPLPVWIRGRSIPGAIVVGVCTHPDFRGRHLMKDMFTFYMSQMRQKGLLAITYKPENIRTYFSLGHYPTTQTLYLSDGLASYPSAGQYGGLLDGKTAIRIESIGSLSSADLTRCFDLYASVAPSYSGMVDRNAEQFALKSRDYASVGGKAMLCGRGNLLGYCFYFDTEEGIYGEEFLVKNNSALMQMIRVLLSQAREKALKVKIPPDFVTLLAQNFEAGNYALAPQNVMGVTDIAAFVRALDLSRFADCDTLRQLVVEVQDRIIPENAVSLNLLGEVSSFLACLSIGIGYFVQFLCGYRTLADLKTDSVAKAGKNPESPMAGPLCVILDEEKAGRIQEVLSPCVCFIVDEY